MGGMTMLKMGVGDVGCEDVVDWSGSGLDSW